MNPILNPANPISPLNPLNPIHHHGRNHSSVTDTAVRAVADTVNHASVTIPLEWVYFFGGLTIGVVLVIGIMAIVWMCTKRD